MPIRDEYHKIKGDKTYGKVDCPLCRELKDDAKHITWIGEHWFLIHNIFPYSGQEDHLMAVPKSHKQFPYQLSPDETGELSEIYRQVKDFFGEQDYFSFTRETMANRSIEHLHTHFLPGKVQGKYIRNMLMNQGFPVVQHLDNDKK